MKELRVAIAATFVLVSGCGGGDGGDAADFPTPQQLTNFFADTSTLGGAEPDLISGAPPASTAGSGVAVDVGGSETTVRDGQVLLVPVTVTNANVVSALNEIFVKVNGANAFLSAPLDEASAKQFAEREVQPKLEGESISFLARFPIPGDAGDGEFCLEFKADDTEGRVSPPAGLCVDVTDAGPSQLNVDFGTTSVAAGAGKFAPEFTITATNEDGVPLAGATVAGNLADPDGQVFYSSATTDSNGQVRVRVLVGGGDESFNITVNAQGGLTRSGVVQVDSTSELPTGVSGNLASGRFFAASSTLDRFTAIVVPRSAAPNTAYQLIASLDPALGVGVISVTLQAPFPGEPLSRVDLATSNATTTVEVISPGDGVGCFDNAQSSGDKFCVFEYDWPVDEAVELAIDMTLNNGSIDYTGAFRDLSIPGSLPVDLGTLRVTDAALPVRVQARVVEAPFDGSSCVDKPVRAFSVQEIEYRQNNATIPFTALVPALSPTATSGGCGATFVGAADEGPGWDFVLGDPDRVQSPYSELQPVSPAP